MSTTTSRPIKAQLHLLPAIDTHDHLPPFDLIKVAGEDLSTADGMGSAGPLAKQLLLVECEYAKKK